MAGNEVGKYYYTEPENIATPPIDAVEKLFRNKDDGQFYFMNNKREIKLVAAVKYRTIAGFLDQAGTDEIAVSKVEDNMGIGYELKSYYIGVGSYKLVLEGLKETEKILIITQSIARVSGAKIETINFSNNGVNNEIIVKSNTDSAAQNGMISNISFKIEVYNNN